jgi:hypothetical protein
MTNDPLELYIARFQMSLTGMTLAIRQDIVDEIRAHVHERMCVSGMPIPEILERLGPPEDLAREYCTGALVTWHDRLSPLVVLRGDGDVKAVWHLGPRSFAPRGRCNRSRIGCRHRKPPAGSSSLAPRPDDRSARRISHYLH